MKDYLTIGEVSKITSLPISTLRYYDSEGIISPNYKDEKTNYRYYRFFQIPIIKMIVHLKKLGFSNAKIKSHLENVSYSHTLELMNKMIEQTQSEIARLQNLEKELKENAVQMKYVGMFAFTIKKDEIEKKTYNYNRLILLKNYEDYEKRCHYPKQKYACMICQSKFDDIGQSVEKVVEWMKKEGREIGEDTIVHILSGPAFEKDPSDVMYILRVPIKR